VLLLCALSLILCGAPAFGQAVTGEMALRALDTDGSGDLQVGEYVRFYQDRSRAADRDGDGLMTGDEFRQSVPAGLTDPTPGAFSGFDLDRDLRLSLGELGAYHGWVFANAIDADRSGAVSVEELAAVMGIPARAPEEGSPERAIFDLDFADRNGKVSLSEFMRWQETRFERIDTSGNGVLSDGEFRAAQEGRAKRFANLQFGRFDTDRNRRMDKREFLSFQAYVFREFWDRDGDGEASLDEVRRLMNER